MRPGVENVSIYPRNVNKARTEISPEHPRAETWSENQLRTLDLDLFLLLVLGLGSEGGGSC